MMSEPPLNKIENPQGQWIRMLWDCLQQHTDKFKVHINDYMDIDDSSYVIKSITAMNKEKGISIVACVNKVPGFQQVLTHFTLKARTYGSGYRNLHSTTIYSTTQQTEIDGFVQKAVNAFESKNAKLLPSQWNFNDQKYVIQQKKLGTRVVLQSEMKEAEVMKIVAIDANAIVSDVHIHEPDNKCWYLLDCVGHAGATFNIISDGEVFYPVSRVLASTKTIRLTSYINKKTVDFKLMSAVDKELVLKAIDEWVQNLAR